jgi:hypothetical protein
MKAKKVVAIGGLAAAGGGAALLIGRLSGSRWAGRVVGNGYRPTGTARAFSANGGAVGGERADHWLVVTVNRPPQEVQAENDLPGPLAELGDEAEVRIRPAPADKGTEISARPRGSAGGLQARISGEDSRQKVRKALRETKQILETGEVLSPDWPPTTKDTPGGKLLGTATSRSRREGLL